MHIIIIPKRHIRSLAALEADDLSVVHEMLIVAAEICRRISSRTVGKHVEHLFEKLGLETRFAEAALLPA